MKIHWCFDGGPVGGGFMAKLKKKPKKETSHHIILALSIHKGQSGMNCPARKPSLIQPREVRTCDLLNFPVSDINI